MYEPAVCRVAQEEAETAAVHRAGDREVALRIGGLAVAVMLVGTLEPLTGLPNASVAWAVRRKALPATTVLPPRTLTTNLLKGPAATVIGLVVAVRLLLAWSVTVMVWLPAVWSVTVKVWEPLSLATKV